MKDLIAKNFRETSRILEETLKSECANIEYATNSIIAAYKNNKKVLIAGNGGSAADSQHIAAELVNSFYLDRKPLRALALTTDTSVITAWGNDKSYDLIFKRQIEAHGDNGDIFLAISTSGNSKNLVEAVKRANEMELTTIGLLGKSGGLLKDICKYNIIVPNNDTARIQEVHHVIYHTICERVEKEFYK